MIKKKAKRPVARRLKPFLKGVVAGLLITLLLTLLFSLLLCLVGANEQSYDTFALIAIGAGCIAGGILIGGGKSRNGFFWGAVGGIIFFFIYALGAIITANADGNQLVSKLVCCVLCSTTGGIIGVNIVQKYGI